MKKFVIKQTTLTSDNSSVFVLHITTALVRRSQGNADNCGGLAWSALQAARNGW
jgi:hypothetical protein